MKIVKNKYGKLFLELNDVDPLTLHKNFAGKYTGATVPLGDLEDLGENISTPLLEDIFFLAQATLQERDRAEIEKGIRYE